MSIASLQTAVETDPGFAPAWAELSPAYGALAYWGHVRPSEVIPKAKAAARRAVELDEALADGHCYVGAAAAYADDDWTTAETELKRAIQLNPNYVEGHVTYGMVLVSLRRAKEALEQFQIAREIDPLQPMLSGQVALCFFISGQYRKAADQLRYALDTAPDFIPDRWCNWRVLHCLGQDAAALQECKSMYEVQGDTEVVRALEQGERRSGYAGAMKAAAQTLAKRARTAYVPAGQVALLYTHAGENDLAVEWVENALKDGDPRLHLVWAVPDWAPLYAKPRFQNVLRKMGFPSVEKSAAWQSQD